MCVMVLVHFISLCYVVTVGRSIDNNIDDEEEKRKRIWVWWSKKSIKVVLVTFKKRQ